MKIIINSVISKGVTGGAQIAKNFILQTLKDSSNVEWYYFVSEDLDNQIGNKFETHDNVHYHVFQTQPDFLNSYISVRKKIKKLEISIRPDLIYTINSPSYFSFKTKEVMRFANAWVTNSNIYAWKLLDFRTRLRMKLYCYLQRKLIKKATFFITQSEIVKEGLLQITGKKESSIKVISNVLPPIFILETPKQKNDIGLIHVACIAGNNFHKNHQIIPKVAFLLKHKYNINNVIFHLTLPLEGIIWKRIEKKTISLNVKECIVNHGYCKQEKLVDIYNKCSICFQPSVLETFSASLIEALYFNLKIIASDLPFNHEAVGERAIYFNPLDEEDAAYKMSKLIQIKDKKTEVDNFIFTDYMDYNTNYNEIVSFLKKCCTTKCY